MVQARLCDIIFSFVSDGVLGGTMMHITPLYCQAFCFTGGGQHLEAGTSEDARIVQGTGGGGIHGKEGLGLEERVGRESRARVRLVDSR